MIFHRCSANTVRATYTMDFPHVSVNKRWTFDCICLLSYIITQIYIDFFRFVYVFLFTSFPYIPRSMPHTQPALSALVRRQLFHDTTTPAHITLSSCQGSSTTHGHSTTTPIVVSDLPRSEHQLLNSKARYTSGLLLCTHGSFGICEFHFRSV